MELARDHSQEDPAVDTAVIDTGFLYGNSDITALTPTSLQTLILGKFPMNVPADHGTHVAGIIGADFDNADPANSGPANGRSGGVSGANPAAAHVYGIP